MDCTNKLTMQNLLIRCDIQNFTFFVGIGVIQGCFLTGHTIKVHLELVIQV